MLYQLNSIEGQAVQQQESRVVVIKRREIFPCKIEVYYLHWKVKFITI